MKRHHYFIFIYLFINFTDLSAKEDLELYQCLHKNCSQKASDYLDFLDSKAGQVFSTSRYLTDDLANLAAAKVFAQASIAAQREPNWIVFKDNHTEKSYGFTYPAVSRKNSRKSNKAGIVFDLFDLNKEENYIATTLGHAHYDKNKCFSYTDLKSFIGHQGKFVLLNYLGELWYVTNEMLINDYAIKRPKDIRKNISKVYSTKSKKEQALFYKKQETGVCGKYIGNIYHDLGKNYNTINTGLL